jgi:hypothetical protein
MPLFRKRPVVIEAEQFRWPDGNPLPAGVHAQDPKVGDGFYIDMPEGGATSISPGDWIITGVNGERYPCKRDIFEKTYEPATLVDLVLAEAKEP